MRYLIILNMTKVVYNVLKSEIDDCHSLRLYEGIRDIYKFKKREMIWHPNLSDTGCIQAIGLNRY